MNNSKLLPVQALTITTSTMLSVSLLTAQQSITLIAKQDAWISMLLGSAIGVISALLVYYLSKRNRGLDLPEITLSLSGNWVGRLLLIPLTVYVLLSAGITIRVFVLALKLFLLDRTPILVISLIMIIVLVSVISKGIDAVAGVIDILFPFFIISIVLLIVLSISQFQETNIKPVLYNNMYATVKASMLALGAISGYGSLAYIMKYISEQEKVLRWFLSGFFISAVLFILLSVATILVFGPEETQRLIFPTLFLSKSIQIGGTFLERLEAFMIVIWIPAVFASVGVYTFASVRNIIVLFGINPKHHRYVSYVHIPILLFIALFSRNQTEALEHMQLAEYLGIFMALGFIPLLVILTLVRKRRKAKVE